MTVRPQRVETDDSPKTPAVVRRCRELVQQPGIAGALAAGLLARLPTSMYALAILLAVADRTGSLTRGGVVAASATVGFALGNPVLGKLVDRCGPRRPLLTATAIAAGALAAFTLALTAGAPVLALIGLALLVGVSQPPVAPCQRALWRRLLRWRPHLLETALTLDSLTLDMYLILGPTLVTAIAALFGAAAALWLTTSLLAVGPLWFALLGVFDRERGSGARTSLLALGALTQPGFRWLLVTILLTGAALGFLRLGLLGAAAAFHAVEVAGLLLAALGVGSAIGGIWYGGRAWRSPMAQRYPRLLLLFALLAALLLTGTSLVLLTLAAVVTGTALTPVTIGEFALIGTFADAAHITEAYGWAVTATSAGGSAGTAAGGWLVEALGWRAAIGVAVAALLTAAAIAKHWLRPIPG